MNNLLLQGPIVERIAQPNKFGQILPSLPLNDSIIINPIDSVKINYDKYFLLKDHYTPKISDFSTLQNINLYYNPSLKIRTEIQFNSKRLGQNGVNYKRQSDVSDWLILLIIFSFILLALVRFFFDNYIRRTVLSVVNTKFSIKLFEEVNPNASMASFLLIFIFLLNFSIYAFEIFDFFNLKGLNQTDYILFIQTFLFICVFFAGKYIINRTVGFIFNSDMLISQYIHHVYIYNKLIGILLFPVILIIPYIHSDYTKFSIYFSVIIISIIIILQILNSGIIIIKKHLPYYYMILYLCSVELLPFLLLFKYLKDYLL
jgi:hypothetical protein